MRENYVPAACTIISSTGRVAVTGKEPDRLDYALQCNLRSICVKESGMSMKERHE
jgi:hypothetical protein